MQLLLTIFLIKTPQNVGKVYLSFDSDANDTIKMTDHFQEHDPTSALKGVFQSTMVASNLWEIRVTFLDSDSFQLRSSALMIELRWDISR